MRRRLLTTVCAGALLAFAPAARADTGQPFTASGQTPTATGSPSSSRTRC